MDEMTTKSLYNSEIFLELERLEIENENKLKEKEALLAEASIKQLESIQDRLDKDPKLKKSLAHIKAKLILDKEFREKTDPDFVQGIMLLDI
jgi:hypothetical protein